MMSSNSNSKSQQTSYIATAVVAATAVGYLGWIQIRRYLERKKPFGDALPVVPNGHWLFGHPSVMFNQDGVNLPEYLVNTVKGNANENGQIGAWMFALPMLVITSWEDARTVLRQEFNKTQVKLFQKHGAMFFGPRNVLTMQGREWKFHRSIVLKALAPSVVEANRTTIVDVAQNAVESIRARIRSSEDKELHFHIVTLMKMITLDVFGQVAFSTDLECTKKLKPSPVAKAFDFLESDFIRRMRSPFRPDNHFYSMPTTLNKKHQHERTMIRSFIVDIINGRRKLGDKKSDLLSRYFDLLGYEDIESIDQAISDAILILIFAGYDTTSVTLSYATCLVSQHPEVQKVMLQEIDKSSSSTDPGDFKYCEGVIREALRMFPPAAATSRYLQKPLELKGGFVAPENTLVQISIWLIHHDPEVFPDPYQFRPDRWVKFENGRWVDRPVDDTSGSILAGNREAFLPFSTGARNCAGMNLAMQEAVLAIKTLHKSLRFRPQEGYVLKPSTKGVIAAPAEDLPMIIEER